MGAGSAGLAAAVAAARAGARVTVLEKAPAVGGNAAFSHTGFRAAYAPDDIPAFVGEVDGYALPGYSVADYAADLDRWRVEPRLRDALAEDSLPALEWMRSLGIPFGFNRSVRGAFEPGLVLAAQALVDALGADRGRARGAGADRRGGRAGRDRRGRRGRRSADWSGRGDRLQRRLPGGRGAARHATSARTQASSAARGTTRGRCWRR